MNVGIDVERRKVSLQIEVNGVVTTSMLTPENALIIADVMKQCALTIQQDDQRRLNEERDAEV